MSTSKIGALVADALLMDRTPERRTAASVEIARLATKDNNAFAAEAVIGGAIHEAYLLGLRQGSDRTTDAQEG